MERLLRRVARVPDDQNTPTHVAAAVQAVVHTPRPESAPAVESAANTAEPAAKQVEPSYEPVRDVPAPAAAPELCPVKEAEARPARVTPLASKPGKTARCHSTGVGRRSAGDAELANRTARAISTGVTTGGTRWRRPEKSPWRPCAWCLECWPRHSAPASSRPKRLVVRWAFHSSPSS